MWNLGLIYLALYFLLQVLFRKLIFWEKTQSYYYSIWISSELTFVVYFCSWIFKLLNVFIVLLLIIRCYTLVQAYRIFKTNDTRLFIFWHKRSLKSTSSPQIVFICVGNRYGNDLTNRNFRFWGVVHIYNTVNLRSVRHWTSDNSIIINFIDNHR